MLRDCTAFAVPCLFYCVCTPLFGWISCEFVYSLLYFFITLEIVLELKSGEVVIWASPCHKNERYALFSTSGKELLPHGFVTALCMLWLADAFYTASPSLHTSAEVLCLHTRSGSLGSEILRTLRGGNALDENRLSRSICHEVIA